MPAASRATPPRIAQLAWSQPLDQGQRREHELARHRDEGLGPVASSGQAQATDAIAQDRSGVDLRQEGRGIGLINKLHAYNLQDLGLNTAEANTHLGFDVDERQYGCAIFILQELGIGSVELITNNPDKVEALRRSPVQVAGRIPLVYMPSHDAESAQRLQKNSMLFV